ncbi:membrane associated rhomboid family serine protease [Haloferula luteola]|uniref:Membrane associated rhomboid family serine protease n=1 Tax=Haloferula luteola TaxID=595692 RepID=A0A840V0S0_9BACT|nr:rhomboid family intramembrane serine protease [Haloferula luteola]MBB5351592.1 membrane associated rhomboid family serine protease [Haloferula luteola]
MRMAVHGFKGLMREQGVLVGLMALMVGSFLVQIFGPARYEMAGVLVPAKVIDSFHHVRAGQGDVADAWQFFTLLSYAFLHGDGFHLTGNLLYFWGFGALVSELLGWRWMLGIFFMTAVAAGLVHLGLNRSDLIPTLGASGAVSGFMGAYLGMALRWHLPNPHIWPMAEPVPPHYLALLAGGFVVMDYYSQFSGSEEGIAFGAHIGGFTMGLVLTALVVPKPALAGKRIG